MPTAFNTISLERQAAYQDVLKRCPAVTSDYSFVNLWAWAEEYDLAWAWEDELVWVRQQKPQTVFWAPIGPWESIDWPNVLNRSALQTGTFTRIPEKLMRLWQSQLENHVTVEEERGQWDYLYSVEDLVALPGNRYHKKKNLLNQFKNKYAFSYHPLKNPLIEKAMAMQQDWCTWRDCEAVAALEAENKAIAKVFGAWEQLTGLMGGALMVGDQMVAYEVAERMPDETLVIHFEKGNPDYKGVYQAINQMFLSQGAHGATIVNREQDLDNDGLRRAKLSYHPVDYLKKYRVTLT